MHETKDYKKEIECNIIMLHLKGLTIIRRSFDLIDHYVYKLVLSYDLLYHLWCTIEKTIANDYNIIIRK